MTATPEDEVACAHSFPGQVTLGAVVSRTCTGNAPELRCPRASVAVHEDLGVPEPDAWLRAGVQLTATSPSTASCAEAWNEATAPAADVASSSSAEGSVSSGAVVSRTETVKLDCTAFACASVAEHATAVSPSANVEPEAGVQLAASDPSTRSDAIGAKVTDAPLAEVASATTSETSSVGAVVSTTWTENEARPTLPWASCAEQETTVVPTAKVLVPSRVQVEASSPSTPSVAVGAEIVSSLPADEVASPTRFARVAEGRRGGVAHAHRERGGGGVPREIARGAGDEGVTDRVTSNPRPERSSPGARRPSRRSRSEP